MLARIRKFPVIGSDGKEYEVFSIEEEVPLSGGQYNIPEYRLSSQTGERLNVKECVNGVDVTFVTLDKELTFIRAK